MNMDIVLGGYLTDVGGIRHQLPIELNPSNLVIEDVIRNVANAGRGVVVLRYKSLPESGPYELEMHVDAGNFLLMLNVLDEDGDHSVRTPTNNGVGNDLISILGEKYSAKVVTRDLSFVCTVFDEFAHTGNVSTVLLS